MANIPFSGHHTADKPAPNNKRRLGQFLEFVRSAGWSVNSLDIGAPNYISRTLGIKDNTHGDLNKAVKAPSQDYDVVTCLEVIQHVMNPLLVLQGIHALMRRGGTLYISTPRLGWLAWYHGKGNFTEYKPDRMRQLLEYAGFRILRERVYNPWPIGFALGRYRKTDYKWLPIPGLRPPFRWLFNRYIIFECEAI